MEYQFLNEMISIRNQLEKKDVNEYNKERFEKCYLNDFSHTPDNVNAIERLEYGITKKSYEPNIDTYGIKIKDKNISLADVAYELECSKVAEFLQEIFPELTMEEVEAAQRMLTTVMLSLEYRKK